jgi:hypothetical protein
MNKPFHIDMYKEKFIKIKTPFIKEMIINKEYVDIFIMKHDRIVVKDSPMRKLLKYVFILMLIIFFYNIGFGNLPLYLLYALILLILYSVVFRIIMLQKNLWLYSLFAVGYDSFILSILFLVISINEYLERFSSKLFLFLLIISLIIVSIICIFVTLHFVRTNVSGKFDDKSVKPPLNIVYIWIGLLYATKNFISDDINCIISIFTTMSMSFCLVFLSVFHFVKFYFIKKLKYLSPDDVGKEID